MPRSIRHLTLFTGSRPGSRPAFAAAARELGGLLAARGITLVYGGASVGLMGEVADAVLGAGGRVVGVIPRWLVDKELAHRGLSELFVVGSMHERKAKMADLADVFVALPGGFGTFDELFEVVTWAQVGLHEKPVGLLDVEGFYAPLLALVDHTVREGFVLPEHRQLLVSAPAPAALLDALERHERPTFGTKWVQKT